MFASLLPKSAPFFEMLMEQNTLLRHMVHHLVGMMENLDAVDDAHKQISLLEEQGDVLHVKIIRDLSQTFITPIDREDILRINQMQEETMDCIHTLTTRLHIFEFSKMRFPMVQMARTISAMLDLTQLMLDVGLAELMDPQGEVTPAAIMDMLKWSQAYDRISMLLENVNSLAETLEEAVLKNV